MDDDGHVCLCEGIWQGAVVVVVDLRVPVVVLLLPGLVYDSYVVRVDKPGAVFVVSEVDDYFSFDFHVDYPDVYIGLQAFGCSTIDHNNLSFF